MGKKSKTAAAAPPKESGMDVDSPPPKSAPAAKGSKRRARDRGDEDEEDDEDGPLGEDEDVEMLDVNFSFFDPQPQDYHSIKLLLSQLLGHVDAATGDLDLAGVTDLVLEQKLVGSTVKTDSGEDDDKANEGDPYAVLTVLNLNVHKDKPAISSLIKYLLSKLDSPASSAFHAQLLALLQNPPVDEASPEAKNQHVGLVLSERMVNMPTQIVPPMYRMLQEELQWAVEDKEPYNFSHLLFLSRVFLSSTAALEDDPNAALEQAIVAEAGLRSSQVAVPKKKKQRKGATKDERDDEKVWMYHPEDEFIQKFAEHKHVYNYTRSRRQGQDGAGDDFGVEQRGQLMLVPWSKFAEVVAGMEDFVGAAVA